MAEGVYLVGAKDGIIRYTNPKFEEMFGYGEGEMLGRHVSMVNAPTDKDPEETAREIMEDLARSGEWHGEIENIRKDGTAFWCYANVSVSDHPDYGKVLVSVHADITERKRAEEALRLTQYSIDHAAETIFRINEQGRFLYVNDIACEELEYSREELESMSVFDIDPNFAETRWSKHWLELKNEGSMVFETQYKTKSGELIEVEVQNNYHEVNDQAYNFAFARDISQRKKAAETEKELHRLEATATLAGGLAHEINNAMSGVMGFAYILMVKFKSNESVSETLSKLSAGAKRAIKLANQLLAYSRQGKYETQKLNLVDHIHDSISSFKSITPGTVKVITVSDSNYSTILGDPTQILQLISNLYQNSLDAIEDEGTITIGIRDEVVESPFLLDEVEMSSGNYVVITVEDNGIGMSEVDMEKAFEPFFTTKFTGRGLGLAAVYGIVKNHDGYISLRSEEGKWTLVEIWFPRAEEDD